MDAETVYRVVVLVATIVCLTKVALILRGDE